MINTEEEIQRALRLIEDELRRAQVRYPGPFHSDHEGYAVILEELDEAWDEIKRNDKVLAREEMIQVGAMAARFLMRRE